MSSLPEQLSVARKWQFEAQLDAFRALTTQIFARTEQVIALNLDTSRAAVERSSNAVKQLFAINDPRDLMTLGRQSQEQFEQMLAYSRELFSIASGAQAPLARQPAAAPAPAQQAAAASQAAPAPQPAQAVQAAPAAEAAPAPAAAKDAAPAAAETAPVAAGVNPGKKPVVATFPEPELEPSRAKPIARAASKLASQPAEPQHPLSSPVVAAGGPVEMPPIAPVEAAPPPAPVSGPPGIDVKQAQRAGGKGNRKK